MALIFLDSNVLVYLSSPGSEFHHLALDRIQSLERSGDEFVISGQVLREFMVVMTYSTKPISAERRSDVLQAVELYGKAFRLLLESQDSIDQLRVLVERYQLRGKVIHDANLVATMLAHGVTTLLTNNPSDFAAFKAEGLRVLPLAA